VLTVIEFFNTEFTEGWAFYVTICFQCVNVVMLFAMVRIGSWFSMDMLYYAGTVLTVAGLAWLYTVRSSMQANLAATVFLGVGTAFCQSASVAIAARIGARAMTAVMTGQGLASVLTGIVGIGFVFLDIKQTELNVFLLFAACLVVLVLIPIVYKWQSAALSAAEKRAEASEQQPRSARAVLADIWPLAVALHISFITTLAVFPGIVSEWRSKSVARIAEIAIAEFQILDTVGRFLGGFQSVRLLACAVPLAVAARLVFAPLFLQLRDDHAASSGEAAAKLVAMFFFALTNGFLATQAMVHIPAMVPRPDRDRAVFLSTVFLVSGLFVGSILAIGIYAID